MSTSIEQRVVQMRFDNKQFESGVAQSMETLDAFEKKLNFKDAAKGFENISKAADQVSLAALMSQTDEVGHKFDAMAVIAITALSRITNAAISAGSSLLKSLSIDQVSSGWSKYEARTAAVQTLVNATGKSVADIEKYMDKLMLYSDETSYGFQDMTSALSTMVSAGGDINKLVPLLEGFGNAVSFVGKGANEYSRAIIQLSQGYGRDALMLEDWKSIESTLGGAKQLKEVFIDVGVELGKIKKGQLDIGTFNESLRTKWLDQEVMEEALGRFAEMTERAFEMIDAGEAETVAQAYEILSETVDDYRIRAAKAAQEAKSFTEAIDATKDAVSTKWMESFQIIFGNYEEATKLWTELTNALYELFAASGDTRNEILSVWKALGGREEMINAFKAAFEALSKPLGAVRDAIHDIFFPGSVDEKGTWLYQATKGVREFFEAITLSDDAVYTLKMTFKALLLPVYAVYQALRVVTAVAGLAVKSIFALLNALLSLPAKLRGMENPLKKIFGDERYARLVESLTIIVHGLGEAFTFIGSQLAKVGKAIAEAFSTKLGTAIAKLGEALRPIGEWILDRIVDGFELLASFDYSKITAWISTALDSLVDGFQIIIGWAGKAVGAVIEFFRSFFKMSPIEILQAIGKAFGTLKDNMVQFFTNIGISDIFKSVIEAGGGLLDVIWKLGEAMFAFISKLTPAKILVIGFGVSLIWVFTNLASAIGAFKKVAQGAVGVLSGIQGVLKAFKQRLSGSPILQAAVAIGVLAISLGALSQIDSDRLISASIALGVVMAALAAVVTGLAVISKYLLKDKDTTAALLKMSESMIFMAGAVGILTAALVALANVDTEGIFAGVFGMIAMMAALVGAVYLLNKTLGEARLRDSVYILSFALSLKMMVKTIADLGEMNLWANISNLGAVVIIVGLLSVIGNLAQGVKFSSGLGLITMVGALILFAKSFEYFAKINMSTAVQALLKFIPILMMMELIIQTVGAESGIGKAALNIVGMSAGLLLIYFAIKKLGSLDLGVLIKGTLTIGALMAFLASMEVIAKFGGRGEQMQGSFFSLSLAILILGVAINYIGNLELGTVIQGTIVVSAVLALLTILGRAIGTTQGATKSVIAMTVCIGVLVTAIGLLTLLDTQELLSVTAGLSLVFIGLAAMFKGIEKVDVKEAIGALGIMVLALSFVSLIFYALQDLGGTDTLVTKATAIGVVLVALGGSFALLQQNKIFNTANKDRIMNTLKLMLGMLAMATIAILALSPIPTTGDMILKAAGVGAILLALAESMSLFNVKTAKWENVKNNIILMTAMLGEVTLVMLAITAMPESNTVLQKAIGLSTILLAVSGALAILSKMASGLSTLGKNFGWALAGVVAGLFAIAGIVGAVVAIGFLFEQGSALDQALTAAEIQVPRIAKVIGSIFGAFVAGIIEFAAYGVGEAIVIIGEALERFAASLNILSEVSLNDSIVEMIQDLGLAVLELTAAGALGGFSLEDFGTDLEKFAPHFVEFCNKISEIKDIDKVSSISKSFSTIAEALALVPTEGGIWGAIFGEADLGDFGEDLSKFAEGMVDFFGIVNGVTIDDAAADSVIKYGNMLAELANSVPISGGFITSFIETDFGKFGSKINTFALWMIKFAEKIDGFTIDTAAAQMIVDCGQAMADLAATIPVTGGFITSFTEANLNDFGEQIYTFAKQIGRIEALISDPTYPFNEEKTELFVRCASSLIDLTNQIPTTGGLVTLFSESSLSDFGVDLAIFGKSVAYFYKSIEDVGITESSITLGDKAVQALIDIYNKIDALTNSSFDFEDFAYDMGTLAMGMSYFYGAIDDIKVDWSNVTSAVDSLTKLVDISDAIRNFSSVNTANFQNYLLNLANVSFDSFAQTFSDRQADVTNVVYRTINSALITAKTMLKQTPASYEFIMDAILTGVDSNIDLISDRAVTTADTFYQIITQEAWRLEDAGNLIMASVLTGIDSKSYDAGVELLQVMNHLVDLAYEALGIEGTTSLVFDNLGHYCIIGFMNGISAKEDSIYAKLTVLGNKIVSTFQAALAIQSPSKKFAEIGMYTVAGFNEGIEKGTGDAVKTIVKMGESLLNAMLSFWGIHSPSTVARDEVGRYIIEGIADGISNDMSAEEAAAQKAQNIINAFQSEFDKWSLNTNTADLEYQLWEALNPGATESEIASKKTELLDKKLQYQAERVNAANAQYQATMKAVGENAAETQKAYNTYLQEQITMANLAKEMMESQYAAGGEVSSIQLRKQALNNYAELYKSMKESTQYRDMTDEEIRKLAAEQSGWQEAYENRAEEAPSSLTGIIDKYMSEATGSIDDLVGNIEVVLSNTSSKARSSGYGAGSSYGGGFAAGISDSSIDIQSSMSTVMEEMEAGMQDSIASLRDMDILDEWRNSIGGIGDMGVDLIGSFSDYITGEGKDISLSSIGSLLSDWAGAFRKGNIEDVQPAAKEVSKTTIDAVSDVPTEFYGIGANADAALAKGMDDNSYLVQNSAIRVAIIAKEAAEKGLEIKSPSRVFYEIGQLIDQGLANGIIDGTSSVETAMGDLLTRLQALTDSSSSNLTARGVGLLDKFSLRPVAQDDISLYTRLLRWDATGTLIPYGYSPYYEHEDARWWIAPDDATANAIRDAADSIEAQRAYEEATRGTYEGTVKDLKDALKNISENQGVNYTQNNYSPEALSASQIYRNTKSALATVSAKVSPTGQSIKNFGTGNTYS